MLVCYWWGLLLYDMDFNYMCVFWFLIGVDGIFEIKFKICLFGVILKKIKNYFYYYYFLLLKCIIF